jgi:hypothetical protein
MGGRGSRWSLLLTGCAGRSALSGGGDSTTVIGATGSAVVEVCVTRSGGQDTYTYRVTYLGGPTGGACGLLVSGYGGLDTVSMTEPAEWTSTAHPTTSCASWWTWSKSMFGSGTGTWVLPRSLTMSMTVDAETTPGTVVASLLFCGKDSVTFTILGPIAPRALTGFEGEGNRINVIGPPEQTIPRCEPSWVKHGFSGAPFDPDSVNFQFFVDGVEIVLNREVTCSPTAEVGVESTLVMFYKQFPEDFFDVGLHEVVGVWTMDDTAAPPDGFVFERTIMLRVIECVPEPLPVPDIPDLRLVLEGIVCGCEWEKDQDYVCNVEVKVIVTNVGTAESPATGVIVRSNKDVAVASVPELEPGESYERTVELSFKSSWDREPCPLSVSGIVDANDEIRELDEENNTAEVEVCCK